MVKKKKSSPGRVVVAMSGGVDSSVAAAILKKGGYEVVGVFIRVWEPPLRSPGASFTGQTLCDWREERRWARRAAAKLEIPLTTFDLSQEYKRDVVDYMINEYRAGRTPNPDVMCNKQIKFGAFWRAAKEKLKADFIATGHYAQTSQMRLSSRLSLVDREQEKSASGWCLQRAKDPAKDQSYFLWAIEPALLPKILFPIGDLKKTEVRKLAKKFGLPNAQKPDSQGLCFVGKIDFKDFLKNFIEEKPGKVLNEAGEVIGKHNGAVFLTLGERHGFRLTKQTPDEKPHYVVSKDLKKNTITVANKIQAKTQAKEILLTKTNWFAPPQPNRVYRAQVRYHGKEHPCQMEQKGGGWWAIFGQAPNFATPGQSLVVYDKKICLGGGVIA